MNKITAILFIMSFMVITHAQTMDMWDGTADTTWYNTTDTFFEITTAEQLAGLAVMVNNGNAFKGKTIELMNDLDLGGELETPFNWMPIGYFGVTGSEIIYKSFSGLFNGNDKNIVNIHINKNVTDTFGFGLFGSIDSACIQNLSVSNVTFDLYNNSDYDNLFNCGCLTGYAKNSIVCNCRVESNLLLKLSFDCIGGIIGRANTSEIIHSAFYGKIEGEKIESVGGIIGYPFKSRIVNCHVIADINGNSEVGGLIGYSVLSIVCNNFFIGKVKGTNSIVGGLIGDSQEDTIENNFVIASATGCREPSQWLTSVGGLMGNIIKSKMENNYITGGKIEDLNFCGGMVGGGDCFLISCYAATYISEKGYYKGNIAGFLGDYSTINNTFMDNNIGVYDDIGSNMATGQVTGLFTEEMTTGNSFGLQDSVGMYPTKWVYEEGLYPQLDVFVNHSDSIFRQASLLSVIPIFLGEQAANHIKNDFKVSPLYDVSWSSSAGDIIRIEGENAKVYPIDKDTLVVLTVSLGELHKEFYVKVLKGSGMSGVSIDKNVALYPNPTSEKLSIYSKDIIINEIRMFDVMGKEVKRTAVNDTRTSISVDDLDNGMYFIKIYTDKGAFTRKVQVMR